MKKYFFITGAILLLILSCKTPGKSDQKIPVDSVNLMTEPSAVKADSVKSSIDSSVEKVDQLINDL
jgi:hypothetical protein